MAYAGSAQFSVFTIDGFDLIPAKLQEATWKTGVRQEQTTGLGDRWEDHTPTGLRFVDITQNGAYFDTRQNGIHEAFKDTPLAYRTLVLAPAGDLPGSPLVVAAGTLSTTYDVQASNGKLTKANVTYVISGAVTEGAIVQPPAAHTAPLPAAMATGRLPTWIVSTTLSVTVLTRDTVPSPLLVTHASGPVTATALGADPTGICCTAWVAGSIRASVPSALSTAHTEPSP